MAVLQSIRNFFVPSAPAEPEIIVPAPPSEYSIKPLTDKNLKEVLRLNIRCFKDGENYTKHTFSYLLGMPETLAYRAVDELGEMTGFAIVMVNANAVAHLTTIGVAPEHRRRGIAARLLTHVENALIARSIPSIMLEVRVGNTDAQALYERLGYVRTQQIEQYYNNDEACFIMVKALN